MLRPEEIDQLQENRLELHFPVLTLERSGPHAIKFEGSGSISQESDGKLILRLYARGARWPRWDEDWIPGKPIPDEDYYTLWGRDTQNREWRSDRILSRGEFNADGAVITAHVRQLVHEEEAIIPNTSSSIEVHFFVDGARIPSNAKTVTTSDEAGRSSRTSESNVLSFDAADLHFRLVRRERSLRVDAWWENAELPPFLHRRIPETVQLLTAADLAPAVVITRNGTVLTVAISPGLSPRVPPTQQPFLWPNVGSAPIHYTTLFDGYLRLVLVWTEDNPHPISREWNGVIRSAVASLETQALVLSIGVEAILKHVPIPQPGKVQPSEPSPTADCLDRLRKIAQDLLCPETFRNRLNGFVGGYEDLRAVDKLYRLENVRVISENLIDAWKALRNLSAHGGKRSGSIDELLQQRDAVMLLIYQLIFHATGYRGAFVNYAAPGWPIQDYPPAPT